VSFEALAKAYLEERGYSVSLREEVERPTFSGFLAAVKQASSRYPGERDAGLDVLEKTYKTSHVTGTGTAVTKTAMTELSGTLGGYLIPTDFTYDLMRVISEESFIYPRATVVPMTTSMMLAPKIDVETATGTVGNPSWFGGVQFSWGSDSTSLTETEPQFRQLSLKAWDLLGYAVLSNQFLMDTGPTGEEYLVKLFGAAAAWQAEYAFLQGVGAGSTMPLGIINAPATYAYSRAIANQVQLFDVAGMASHLIPFSFKKAIWACSPSALQYVTSMQFYAPNYGCQTDVSGYCGTLMSRPLFVTDKLPALGSAGDLLLFDPSLYIIGERMQVMVDVSDQVNFRNYQTVFRIWMRLDGKPQVSSTITAQDNTTTLSPYVMLK
jgi:HK97 family phage major capsid protein